MRLRAFSICVFLFCSTNASLSAAAVEAFITDRPINPEISSAAVDSKGLRHRGRDYLGKTIPWLSDQIKAVAPDYPYWERASHHQGTGMFRVALELKTGAVTKVAVLKSSGFKKLDECAVAALRRWHWKPGKWKEIDVPVTFVIGKMPTRLPAGMRRIPNAIER